MWHQSSRKVLIAGWVFMGLMVNGHITQGRTAQPQTGLSAENVKKIGVLLFVKGKCDTATEENLNCPLGRFAFNPENIAPDSDYMITNYVQEILQKRMGEKVIPLKKAMNAYIEMPKNEFSDTPRALAQTLGQVLGADLMVAGFVLRYKKRIGSAMAISEPASVGFAAYLLNVANGRMLWSASFSETQHSLSENILDARAFFKRGAKWLTADELARYGVNKIFEKFPF